MKQQINLYQAEFHELDIPLSSDQIFLSAGAVLLLMVLVSSGLALSNVLAANRLATAKVELEALKQSNTQMSNQIQARVVDQKLATNSTDAGLQLQARQQILQLVERAEQQQDAVYFSELLGGLGRQHVSGMWLSRIDISAGGRGMHLEGSTLDAKLVPQFVGKLSQEKAYAGREFRKVLMIRNEKDASLLDFVLTTEETGSESILAFTQKSGSK